MQNVTLSERPSIINPEPTVNVTVKGLVIGYITHYPQVSPKLRYCCHLQLAQQSINGFGATQKQALELCIRENLWRARALENEIDNLCFAIGLDFEPIEPGIDGEPPA